ncbi:MAG: GNAT family N-acetyltransferase [Nitrospinota bacterium]|jgi:ribosomal protein S18 acetylase RimI-like enzyme|nr:GNAT family N-acetyltransferase [Nitrospinota bacterium]MDP6620101.1 GNAT family N-acetyltransferase [Nitrospinota bacterium]
MSAPPTSHHLRTLRSEDLDWVVEIDRRIAGRSRAGFFEKRLQASLADPEGFIVVAAESGGVLNGYAIARFQDGEFDDDRPVALLDAIGVDPDCQRQGLGKMLIEGIDKVMRMRGVQELRTQAAWTDHALMRFFASVGFSLAPHRVLERSPAGGMEG